MNNTTSQDACKCSAVLHCMITHTTGQTVKFTKYWPTCPCFSQHLWTLHTLRLWLHTQHCQIQATQKNCVPHTCTVHTCNKTINSTVKAKSSTRTLQHITTALQPFAIRALHKEHVLGISHFFVNLAQLIMFTTFISIRRAKHYFITATCTHANIHVRLIVLLTSV